MIGSFVYRSLNDEDLNWIRSDPQPIELQPGTYFVKVYGGPSAYELTMTAVPLPDAAFEPNNSFATAKPISLDFTGELFLTPYDVDLFKFTVDEAQIVSVTAGAVDSDDSFFELKYALYDAAERLRGASEYHKETFESYLTPGTYYLRAGHGAIEDRPGAYTVSMQAKLAPDSRYEPNDSPQQATRITPGVSDTFYLGGGDEDWFVLDVQNAATLEVDNGTNLSLYDGSLNLITFVRFHERLSAEVQPGTYYLKQRDSSLLNPTHGPVGYEYSLDIRLLP